MNQPYARRMFLSRSVRVVGGLTVVSSLPVLWGCGSDDDSGSDTTAASNAGSAPAATGGGGGEAGTVGTQFNWVPDVEWAAWYLGDANGHFAERNVTSELGHGGPNTPAVVQVLAAGSLKASDSAYNRRAEASFSHGDIDGEEVGRIDGALIGDCVVGVSLTDTDEAGELAHREAIKRGLVQSLREAD